MHGTAASEGRVFEKWTLTADTDQNPVVDEGAPKSTCAMESTLKLCDMMRLILREIRPDFYTTRDGSRIVSNPRWFRAHGSSNA